MRALLYVIVLGCGDAQRASRSEGVETGATDSGVADSGGVPDADADGVTSSDDCDDHDATVHPGATEVWYDGVDQDCDGNDDDQDGDGYAAGVDCDDEAASVHPGLDEHCDEVDEDCDGEIDEDAIDPVWVYFDTDADGFGNAAAAIEACPTPAGYVDNRDDCDDTDPEVYPGAEERCDEVDDDCDGETDEADAVGATLWYSDLDHDGYGDPGTAVWACAAPASSVSDDTDCDDADAGANPGLPELCAFPADEDCDGEADEATAADVSDWFVDADGDGFGDPTTGAAACAPPAGTVVDATDCDDTVATTFPGAPETCDGAVDDDCDAIVDDGCFQEGTYAATTGAYAIHGASDGEYIGYQLAWSYTPVDAGYDVDGDGIADVVTFSYRAVGGAVELVSGAALSGDVDLDAPPSSVYSIQDSASGHGFGLELSLGPDLAGDGYADLLVRDPQTGDTSLFETGLSGLSSPADASRSWADAGWTYSGGAEYAEVGLGTLAGGAAVVRGSYKRLDVAFLAGGSATVTPHDSMSCWFWPASVLVQGDLDGDGFDDVVLGDEGGESLSVFTDVRSGDALECGDEAYSGFGYVPTWARSDFDGDGLVDLVAGNPKNDAGGLNAGVAYVYGYDASSGTLVIDTVVYGDADMQGLGGAAAGADLDADGVPDLVLPGGGSAYVLYGSHLGGTVSLSSVDATITGISRTIAATTDIVGDGREGIFVSDYRDATFGATSGAVFGFAGD